MSLWLSIAAAVACWVLAINRLRRRFILCTFPSIAIRGAFGWTVFWCSLSVGQLAAGSHVHLSCLGFISGFRYRVASTGLWTGRCNHELAYASRP
jgi:hypothetical protein